MLETGGGCAFAAIGCYGCAALRLRNSSRNLTHGDGSIDVFAKMPFLSSADRQQIEGGSLLALLAEVAD